MTTRRSLAKQAFRANAGSRASGKDAAYQLLTHGTGNKTMDKILTASAVTGVVAAILVMWSPPMIEKKSRKKYHLPRKCMMRMMLYMAITFGLTLVLCYLPFFD